MKWYERFSFLTTLLGKNLILPRWVLTKRSCQEREPFIVSCPPEQLRNLYTLPIVEQFWPALAINELLYQMHYSYDCTMIAIMPQYLRKLQLRALYLSPPGHSCANWKYSVPCLSVFCFRCCACAQKRTCGSCAGLFVYCDDSSSYTLWLGELYPNQHEISCTIPTLWSGTIIMIIL